MQRISDIVCMFYGAAKVGQATLRLAQNEVLHLARSSSVIGPVMQQCNEMREKVSLKNFKFELLDKIMF